MRCEKSPDNGPWVDYIGNLIFNEKNCLNKNKLLDAMPAIVCCDTEVPSRKPGNDGYKFIGKNEILNRFLKRIEPLRKKDARSTH